MDQAKLDRLMSVALSDGTQLDEDALLPIVVECCDQDDEREDIASEGLGYVLTERLTSRFLLGFDWESWGAPTSSSDFVLALTVRSHIYLCLSADPDGLHPFVVRAAALAADGRAGVSAMVQTQLPRLVGDIWTSRLPTSSTNMAPDLLDGQAVKLAYQSIVQDPDSWEALLIDLALLVSPHTSLSLASDAPSLLRSDRDAAANDRSRTFDEWFTLTYRESDP